MKFHIGETMTPTENLLPLAQIAEDYGYDGYCVSDSIMYPQASDTTYSYGDGGRAFLENKDVVESFVLASAIGARHPSLEVTTSVVKLPVRHPIYAAKLACSVSALTGGRFNFGVGLSVWPEDYRLLGIPYEDRGARLDECIAIVRGLAGGDYFEFHGKFYDFPATKIRPAARNMPIFIGGHSDAALRRAARNDGWSSAGAAAEDLADMIGRLNRYRAELGRDGPFRIFESRHEHLTYDEAQRLRDAGVTDIIVYERNVYQLAVDDQPIADKRDRLGRLADTVIARMKG